MAKLYVSEHPSMSIFQGNNMGAVDVPVIAQNNLTIGGASVQSSSFNAKTKIIRVHCDATCSIEIGLNPTATTASHRLPANSTEYLVVAPGQKLAVIANV